MLYPSRGLIYDRNGKLLVNNNAMFDLMFTYTQVNPKMDTAKFCQLLGITKDDFLKKINKNWSSNRYDKRQPTTFLKKISASTFARFQENLYEFPGFFIQVRNVRSYPYPYGAHLLGYISEVNQAQIDKSDGKYKRGDYIGASGLEYEYEDSLRGTKGRELVLKDNMGRKVGPYKDGKENQSAVSGRNLVSSIDIDLQAYAEQLMVNKTGSVVAIEPKSGEILAMVSMPTYDPNLLTINRNRGKAFSQLSTDSLRPFFDRAVMAQYPPGSIFKTVMGLVAMQMGVTTPSRYIPCPGYYNNNGTIQKCHHHTPCYGIEQAIEHSCNTYFFNLLRNAVDKYGYTNAREGLDTLASYWEDFGLGHPLGVDYPNEVGGNIPNSKLYDRIYPNKNWRSPTITSIGIGQGEVQLTTIQMANLAAIIANKGKYYTPHLIKGYLEDGKMVFMNKDEPKKVRVREEFFPPVIDGMEKVVISGTARIAYIPDISICGKTGTSQNPAGADHSVFFAFAPKDNPRIAIAVYVEHGVWGARYAAPIASLMIEKYLKKEISQKRKYLEKRMIEADLIHTP
ncbi:MAG TPA: penicillin-binding protein 2 [Phaeodactylibacter sp.]|nr:penicillin-binding protein 2 [Phaeodactylibacter sp.]